MLQSFDEWRKTTMSNHAPQGVAHYHLCGDLVFSSVANFLRSCLVERVESNRDFVNVCVDEDTADSILIFLDEMRVAYLHPRSDAAKYIFAQLKASAKPFLRKKPTALAAAHKVMKESSTMIMGIMVFTCSFTLIFLGALFG
jgi:hypothetical protein